MAIPAVAASAVQARTQRKKGAGPGGAYPYNGGSRRNIAPPGPAPAAPTPAPSVPPSGGAGPASPSSTPSSTPEQPAAAPDTAAGRSWRLPSAPGAVRDGSGILLGFIAWVWVVLPYLDGGLPRVRNVLAAKLTNTGPDGSPLP